MIKVIKKNFIPIIYLLGFLGTYPFCLKRTDGFSIAKIQSNLFFNPSWEIKESKFPIGVFDQPFYYLGSGAQVFAFVSKDGQYVIKFFRHHRMRHPLHPFSFLFPQFLQRRLQKTIHKRKAKQEKDFSSYKLAYEMLPEETGVLYLHLNKTNHLNTPIVLYDKIGIRHTLELDQIEFILQRKADLLYFKIETLINQGNLNQAEKILSNLIQLLWTRSQKGIIDKNPDLKTNFGVIGERSIQIDIGRFKKDPHPKDPETTKQEMLRITDPLCHWLDEKAASLSKHIRKEIKELR